MGSFSDYLEDILLDHIFLQSTYTPLSPIFLGLCTASPTDVGTGANCNEHPNEKAYERVITISVDWSISSNGIITNAKPLTFKQATGNWTEVTHFGLFTSGAIGLGEMLMWGELYEPISVLNTEILIFAVADIRISLD